MHDTVLREVLANLGVVGSFVGHKAGFSVKVLNDNRSKGAGLEVVNNHAPRLPGGAVDQGQNLVLVVIAPALLLAIRLDGTVMADEGFIDLNSTTIATKRGQIVGTHRLADTVAHEPCGFQGDAQGTVKLVRADALLAGRDQIDRLHPDMHLHVATFKDGADLHGEGLAAGVALVHPNAGALAVQLAGALGFPAVRARAALGPNAGLNKLVSGFFVVELRFVENRHITDPFRVPTRYVTGLGTSSIISP